MTPLRVLIMCEKGSVAVIWNWNWRLVLSRGLSLDADVSDMYGWFWESRSLRIVFGRICTGSLITCITAELVGGNIPIYSVGGIFCDFKNVCIWIWNNGSFWNLRLTVSVETLFWFFNNNFMSVIINWFERHPSLLSVLGLFG